MCCESHGVTFYSGDKINYKNGKNILLKWDSGGAAEQTQLLLDLHGFDGLQAHRKLDFMCLNWYFHTFNGFYTVTV